ncbi:hypothetical protein RZN05_18175 [Sphingomonas sp. HF-S4]|uniref:Uncharacterized protein n=1 Tax=Sphingomonas agrestis TaxID=3080540 RepID=A0ABU3YC04_9SPHN|nr:hypothetical protein [Sphingomonas sp. HF-S4]MDV3458930.1 hypothetical protein [Sphingomonas sp. HF-S4]
MQKIEPFSTDSWWVRFEEAMRNVSLVTTAGIGLGKVNNQRRIYRMVDAPPAGLKSFRPDTATK